MTSRHGPYHVIDLEAFVPADAAGDELELARRLTRLLVAEEDSREGATSVVLRARNAAGEDFALKVMKAPRGGMDSDAVVRAREETFLEEYRNQLAVSNLRGFPSVYGWGRAEGRPAILMEWVEGTSLRDALRETGTWRAERVAGLGTAVLEILDRTTALDRGFVHRDLSPRNILLRTSERGVAEQLESGDFDVCLVDMGSASSVCVEDGTFTMLADIWRNATPDYASPEMLTRDVPGVDEMRHSSAIDVYALCSVLYELYCGEPPYRVFDHPETSPYLLKMSSDPRELEPAAPRERELCRLVMSGLARDPGRRPTVASLLSALRAWLSGDKSPSRELVPYEPESEASREGARPVSRRGVVLGAAAGMAAVAGLGAAAWATGGFGILRGPRGIDSLSWDDLSEVSLEMTDAGDEDGAVEVARRYGICDDSGAIDGSVSKTLVVAGAELAAQVAGFAHDVRTDGSPIGLTFLLTSLLPEERPMSEEPYMGGWEDSDLRAWLNDVLLADLPEELARNIVPAGKLTNSAGAAKSADDVTLTEDALWLPSYVEIVGERPRSSFSDGFQYLADVLNAEGSQYKLFRDQAIFPRETRQELVRSREGEPAYWWLRTASPDVSESEGMAFFNRTGPNGDPFHFATACTDRSGILVGFCI